MNDAWIDYILKRMEMAEDWDGIDDRARWVK